MGIVPAKTHNTDYGVHKHPISDAQITSSFGTSALKGVESEIIVDLTKLSAADTASSADSDTIQTHDLLPPSPEAQETLARLKNIETLYSRYDTIGAANALLNLGAENIPSNLAGRYMELADRIYQSLGYDAAYGARQLEIEMNAVAGDFKGRVAVNEEESGPSLTSGLGLWNNGGNKIQSSTNPSAQELAHSSPHGSVEVVTAALERKQELAAQEAKPLNPFMS